MRRRLWAWVSGTVAVSVAAFVAVVLLGWAPLLGLDLQGGISVVYRPAHPVKPAVINETIAIISNRVSGLSGGLTQPNITSSGGNISVELPGIKNRAQALSIIGQTAELYFRPVLCAEPVYSKPLPKGQKTPPTLTGPPPACNASVNFADVPSTPRSLDTKGATVLLPTAPVKGVVQGRYILGPAAASGTIIKTATAALGQTGQWQVNFILTPSGSPIWDSIAKASFHKQLGIALDGVVESAPQIQPNNKAFSSFGGQGQITGANFTQSTANTLALELRYGALPVQLVRQTVMSISPTLGKSSLVAGIFAALVGLALVFGYTVLYYRGLGIVVLLGLAVTAALLWAIISYLGHSPANLSLDLSGITGLIVSVGVVADSYIVFFERLKDEVRAGKSVGASVDRGFAAAFRTIIAADLVSLIGAVVLYIFSVAQVKGFAFYLGLSTLLDMVTAWTFTRPLVILLGRSRTFTEARFIGVARGLARADGGERPSRSERRAAKRALPEVVQ
ncbi:MAG: protein translocase subunit SecD [Acidimicrobiales bacterium]